MEITETIPLYKKRKSPGKAPRSPVAKSKPKKPPTISKLKKKLDTLFSIYIRAKYQKSCYTCGGGGRVLQCGHFVSRMYLPTRWDENNARPQCRMCNCMMNGRAVDFEERLIQEVGAEEVQRLKTARREIWKLDEAWYYQKIQEFEAKIKEYQQLLEG